MSKFQALTIGIFIVFIIVGVATFATYKGNSASGTALPAVTIWGTFPDEAFNNYISGINRTLAQPVTIYYTQKTTANFSRDFISALARGQGPDAILIPADMLIPHLDKITLIPFSTFSQRDFLDTYVQEGETYLSPNGILAIPFTVDPLVMYWNRDMFSAAGLATYPKYWDEFTALNKQLTSKDQNGNIRKSAVAMGDFSNISNAREILGTLFMQVGNSITSGNAGSSIESALNGTGASSPVSALQFFTQFANPANVNYSWNKGMANSKSAFLAGTLATYFGFASEIGDIRSKNANLNFDVALMPQIRTNGHKAVYGRMYGLSIVNSSPNQNAVYQVFALLTDAQNIPSLTQTLYIPSIRRDLITKGASDPYISIFNQAALISKTWLDADPIQSYKVFANMVASVTSGGRSAGQAVQDANEEYNAILEQALQ